MPALSFVAEFAESRIPSGRRVGSAWAEGLPPGSPRLARDAWFLIALAVGGAFLAPTYLPLFPRATVEILNTRFSDLAMLAVVIAGLLAGRSRLRARDERSFWSLLAAGLGFFLAVEVIDRFSLFGPEGGSSLLKSILFVGLYVCTCIAVELKPHAPHLEAPTWRWRRRLEASGVIVLGLGLFTYFSVLPEIHGLDGRALNAPTLLLYAVFDLYLFVRGCQLFAAAREPSWRTTYGLLAAVFAFWFAADLAEAGFWMELLESPAIDHLLDALWLPPYLGIAAARAWRRAALAAESLNPSALPAGDDLEDRSAWALWRRPLWLQALTLPVVHLALGGLGLHSPTAESAQHWCALIVAATLIGFALADQRQLEIESSLLELDRRRAREAEQRAHRDPLTGLPNRFLLLDHLALALAQARRAGSQVGIAFLDLDRFKVVNEALGHIEGDLVLRAVAERLQAVVRAGDTLGRIGGDEFVLVATGLQEAGDATVVVEKLLCELRRPFAVGEVEMFVTASAGLVLFPDDGDAAEDLLRRADRSMRRSKEQGGDRATRAELDVDSGSAATLDLETLLRKGLEDEAFALVFQPIVELASGRVRSCEALLRWRHPARGWLGPGEFLAVAESVGVIARLTPWLFSTACRAAAEWPEQDGAPVSVSVNLSARQFLDPALPQHVEGALARSGLDGRRLEIEITESVAMAQPARMARALSGLRELGVRISIDDFGTGHSSLAMLRLLPVDTLKIDASFVRGIDRSAADSAIVTAILAMAGALGLETVAEGVEQPSELDFLRQQRCGCAQGYLLAHPLGRKATAELLSRPRLCLVGPLR